MIVCSNCGQPGHRRFECKEARNITNNLICRICGGAGHMASDCLHRDNPEMLEQSRQRSEQIDQELSSFLSQIGGTSKEANANAPAQQPYNPYADYSQVPPPYYGAAPTPWGDSSTAAAPWATNAGAAAPAPWTQPQTDQAPTAPYYPPNPWAMPPPPPPPPQQ
jgi:splicing factor 1